MSTIFLTTCVTSQLNIFRQNTNASQIVSYVQSEDWKVQQRLAEIDKYNLLYDHILICFPVVMHLTSLLCIIYIIFLLINIGMGTLEICVCQTSCRFKDHVHLELTLVFAHSGLLHSACMLWVSFGHDLWPQA